MTEQCYYESGDLSQSGFYCGVLGYYVWEITDKEGFASIQDILREFCFVGVVVESGIGYSAW